MVHKLLEMAGLVPAYKCGEIFLFVLKVQSTCDGITVVLFTKFINKKFEIIVIKITINLERVLNAITKQRCKIHEDGYY